MAMAMAAKGVVRSVSMGLMRASAARGGAPHLGAPTSAARGLSTARAGLPSLGQIPITNPSGNLSLGGTRLMSSWKWDDNIPLWMYGSIHDPEIVFHRMKVEDKELARLVQLMINDSMGKVQERNGEGVKVIMRKLQKISNDQKYQEGGLDLLFLLMGAGAGCVYHEKKNHR